MRRHLLVLGLLAVPGVLGAQASQFGVRGLGLPVTPSSVRSLGAGGAFGLFDMESALNPASIAPLTRNVATFALRQSWRTSENAFGKASGNDTQFPQVFVGGALGARFDISVSASAYADRSYAEVSSGILMIRGEEIGVNDTLTSRGGISDLRLAVSFTPSERLAMGVGLHVLTGTNRIEFRRSFSDAVYQPVRLRNELGFAAPGVSFGVMAQPFTGVELAGFARIDGDLTVDKDEEDLGAIPLPVTLGGGLQIAPSRRLQLAGHVIHRSWDRADAELVARGGTGARAVTEMTAGLEWLRNRTNPSSLPLRAGVRLADLPFALAQGEGREVTVALGTGFRFTAQRGSVDIALERVWREEGSAFTERGFQLTIGVGIRP